MRNQKLHKPNQLINIAPEEEITLTERKGYNIMLKYAQDKLKFENHKSNTFEIPRKLLHQKANLKNKDREYIRKTMENLMKTIVRIYNYNQNDNCKEWAESFTLLTRFGITEDGLNYRFGFNDVIIEALKNQRYFTPLDLLMINSLDSQYSILFYELAIEYRKYGIPKMTIEQIRKLTNTQDKYKRTESFKRRVLDKACDEISKKTDIILSYNTEKRGRKIAFIDFEIKKKEIPMKIESKVKEQEYSSEVLELFKLLPKEEKVETHKKELENLLKDYSLKYLKGDIKYAKEFKPDNFMGFLKVSCQSGHFCKAELEKEEKNKELAKKREEEKRKRKVLQERIEKKAKEKALEKYELLSEVELDKYNQEYAKMIQVVPESIRPAKREYIFGALEDKFKEELRELSIIFEN